MLAAFEEFYRRRGEGIMRRGEWDQIGRLGEVEVESGMDLDGIRDQEWLREDDREVT